MCMSRIHGARHVHVRAVGMTTSSAHDPEAETRLRIRSSLLDLDDSQVSAKKSVIFIRSPFCFLGAVLSLHPGLETCTGVGTDSQMVGRKSRGGGKDCRPSVVPSTCQKKEWHSPILETLLSSAESAEGFRVACDVFWVALSYRVCSKVV